MCLEDIYQTSWHWQAGIFSLTRPHYPDNSSMCSHWEQEVGPGSMARCETSSVDVRLDD